ncbi:putative two-component membrane permease complex subunit [Anaerotignum neopropionicum]|uniref:Putative two-component membrane permease complex subunit n=1 Tax=Anaerotignum neopropionicum TaxID=36847 RepID=A0A136WCH4_9FIRM|nr:permease [Anaerotignum neopropionicum]KXL52207.1 putative two-component membrane permease complex subunit [Anaerotignum neopropionicum]
MEAVLNALLAGWHALVHYLTISRIIMLIIAFFLSGAISQFMSQGAVMKYFGPNAKKGLSYLIASVSGAILAVCSCSVLPMFASIRKKGAGIGPAVTFLFAGPAINILAITFTFSLIGVDIGFVRVFGAVGLSVVIGLIMYLLFNKSEVVDANASMFNIEDDHSRKTWQNIMFFVTLIAILVSGVKHPIITGLFAIGLIVELVLYFKKDELLEWCRATFDLAKKIVPLFIIGVFLAGVIEAVIPPEYMVKFVGNNSFGANAIAAVFGAFMYFATLTEVPIVNSFMALGMLKGPATALLLAGPSLSLPNMIVISKVMGIKKTLTYVGLVIVLSALIGMLAGYIIYI